MDLDDLFVVKQEEIAKSQSYKERLRQALRDNKKKVSPRVIVEELRRTWKNDHQATEKDNLVILPFFGEWGWFVMHHIKFCYGITKPNVICCQRGQECFFPQASSFYYDWHHPLSDDKRAGDGSRRYKKLLNDTDNKLRRDLNKLYNNHSIIRPNYVNCWRNRNLKFPIIVENYFAPFDIVIAPRYRPTMAPERNLNWDYFVNTLRDKYRIGIAGAKDSSKDYGLPSAWDHPLGPSAGTADMLSHCRMYIGGDSGVSHQATFQNTPSMIIRSGSMFGMFDSIMSFSVEEWHAGKVIDEVKRYLAK